MFRTQNNVPEIYVNGSRDFQLLCRLKDAMFGGVKYNIDSLKHTSNTMEMNNVLLPLLKSKVGFFSDDTLTEDQLRILLNAFPTLIKHKGSKKAIYETIHAWFRLHQISGKLISIDVDNIRYKITLNINSLEADTSLLDTIFEYIIPSAYEVEYRFATDYALGDNFVFDDNIDIITISNKTNSRIQTKDAYGDNAIANRLVGSVGLTEIATKEDLTSAAVQNPDPDIYPKGGNS